MPTHLGLDPSLVDFSRPADPDVPPFLAAARAAYTARSGGDEVPELYEDGSAEQYDEDEDDGEYYDDEEDEDEELEAKEAVYASAYVYSISIGHSKS